MQNDIHLTPGLAHPVKIEAATSRWHAKYENHVIADSATALVLREAHLPAVVYFPREAVAMEYMSVSDTRTHCPYKGDATHYALMMDGVLTPDAAWSYETPYDTAEAIRGYVAFYRDKVEVYAVEDAAIAAGSRNVDEVVRHTDAGDGAPQPASWRPDRV